jgi:hypothetical protein
MLQANLVHIDEDGIEEVMGELVLLEEEVSEEFLVIVRDRCREFKERCEAVIAKAEWEDLHVNSYGKGNPRTVEFDGGFTVPGRALVKYAGTGRS